MNRLACLRGLAVACALALLLAGGGQGLALAQTAPSAAGAAGKSASESYEQALVAFNLGEIRTAYIFTKNALQSDPFLLPAHLLLGKIYLQLGHGDRAEKELLIADGLGVNIRSAHLRRKNVRGTGEKIGYNVRHGRHPSSQRYRWAASTAGMPR